MIMTRPNVPDRAISKRSEESTDTATTAMKTLRADLFRLRVPTPPAIGMVPPRVLKATGTTAVKAAASATEQA
jgi:hypothetical protein